MFSANKQSQLHDLLEIYAKRVINSNTPQSVLAACNDTILSFGLENIIKLRIVTIYYEGYTVDFQMNREGYVSTVEIN